MKYIVLIIMITLSISTYAQDIEKIANSEPFTFGGSVSGKLGFASISGIEQRTAPYYYVLNTRLKFSFYSFQVPVYFSFRNNNLNFGSNLPRLKISPKYKWASMQIGDVYTRFNSYVLDNRNMRGAAIKLTPGKMRFQAIYGKMKDLNSYRDTLLLGTLDVDTYSRKVIGLGIGFGTNRSYLDVYALRAWDDELESFYTSRGVNQKSNTILGLSTRLRLLKSLSFQTNIGLSALTQDVNFPGDTENLYENNITGSLVDLNATSNVNIAGDVSLNYRYRKIGLSLRTRYVQPHYQPLSVAYINTDLLDYTLGANLSILKNKLFVNGRFGIQKNNLSQQDAITNKRLIYNLNATAKLSKSLTSSLIFANFSNQLQASSININELYTYSVTNSSTNLLFRYRKSNEDGIISSLNIGRTNFTIVAEQAEEDSAYGSVYARLDLGYNWEAIGADARIGFGRNAYTRKDLETTTYTITGRANKKLLGKKLSLGFDTRYTLIDVIEYREGTNWLNQLNLNYKISEKGSLLFYLAYLNRSSYINPTFSEIRSAVTYSISF